MMSGLLNLPSTLNISGYAEIFINLERSIYDRARALCRLGLCYFIKCENGSW